MSLFYNLREGVSGAINYVVDKNRKISLINRIKTIIRQEEKNANQAYIALGKYYFNHLRDPQNGETEFYCMEIEHANRRIGRAMMKLDELTEDQAYIYDYEDPDVDFDEDFFFFCSGGCESCGCFEGMNPGTGWDNLAAVQQMKKEHAQAQRAAEHPEEVDGEELEVELDDALENLFQQKKTDWKDEEDGTIL